MLRTKISIISILKTSRIGGTVSELASCQMAVEESLSDHRVRTGGQRWKCSPHREARMSKLDTTRLEYALLGGGGGHQ